MSQNSSESKKLKHNSIWLIYKREYSYIRNSITTLTSDMALLTL